MSDVTHWLLRTSVPCCFPTASCLHFVFREGLGKLRGSAPSSKLEHFHPRSVSWIFIRVGDHFTLWSSVCLQVWLLRLQAGMSFPAICMELWEQCIWEEGKKSEISVSEVYCTFGSLSWCLWKQKVRKQVNLSSWDQATSPPWKGIRERRWDFSGRWLGEGLEQADKALGFFQWSCRDHGLSKHCE